MKNKMTKLQKYLSAVLVMAIMLAAFPLGALAAAGASAPRDSFTSGPIALSYIGAKACRAVGTVTAQSCAAAGSRGLLYALCAYGTSAVVGKGAMAFDTASVSGLSSFDVADAFAKAYSISPIVFGTAQAAAGVYAQSVYGCWVPPAPVRYESGFALMLNDTSLFGLALVRPDNGVNP